MTAINDLHDMFLETIWTEPDGNWSDFVTLDQLENSEQGSVIL